MVEEEVRFVFLFNHRRVANTNFKLQNNKSKWKGKCVDTISLDTANTGNIARKYITFRSARIYTTARMYKSAPSGIQKYAKSLQLESADSVMIVNIITKKLKKKNYRGGQTK